VRFNRIMTHSGAGEEGPKRARGKKQRPGLGSEGAKGSKRKVGAHRRCVPNSRTCVPAVHACMTGGRGMEARSPGTDDAGSPNKPALTAHAPVYSDALTHVCLLLLLF
jgi:hypothetical protein